MEYPEYYPSRPYTLVTDAPVDPEGGHEFVLHFDIEEERYHVFFFAQERHAIAIRDEYERITGNRAIIIRFPARDIEDRFSVRYTNRAGEQADMSIEQYRRNMELRSEFRRSD